jgi:hypothetical protein
MIPNQIFINADLRKIGIWSVSYITEKGRRSVPIDLVIKIIFYTPTSGKIVRRTSYCDYTEYTLKFVRDIKLFFENGKEGRFRVLENERTIRRTDCVKAYSLKEGDYILGWHNPIDRIVSSGNCKESSSVCVGAKETESWFRANEWVPLEPQDDVVSRLFDLERRMAAVEARLAPKTNQGCSPYEPKKFPRS